MTAPTLPLTIEGSGPVAGRLRRDRDEVRARLTEHGAVLLRGFDVGGVDGFAEAVRALAGEPLTYTEQSSPRTRIKGNV